MNLSILQGVTIGIILGGAFSWLQLQALRKNELLAKRQQLPSILKRLPGSGVRVAFLLMALVLVQIVMPAADKWWLTGSLIVSSSIPILWRLTHLSRSRV